MRCFFPSLHRHFRARTLVKMAVIMGLGLSMSDSAALAQDAGAVSVHCSAPGVIPGHIREMLCAGLQAALRVRYPDKDFVRIPGEARLAGPSVTLETLASSETGMELRLIWQTPEQGKVEGDPQAFSIVDKTMTPDLQLKFLNRVVQDAALPF